MASPLLRMEY